MSKNKGNNTPLFLKAGRENGSIIDSAAISRRSEKRSRCLSEFLY